MLPARTHCTIALTRFSRIRLRAKSDGGSRKSYDFRYGPAVILSWSVDFARSRQRGKCAPISAAFACRMGEPGLHFLPSFARSPRGELLCR